MPNKPHEKYRRAAELVDLLPPSSEEADGEQPLPEDLDALCRLHVCPTCDVQARAEDIRLRALAETENTKKRLQREQEECLRFAAERILNDLLPTLDTLDLALQYGTERENCKDVLQGVEMTRKLLFDTLNRHGLEALGERGEAFTPECHEAIGFDEDGDLDEGRVARVLQRGYRLKDRLLRPAKVLVARR